MDRAGADCDRRDRFCFPASAFKSGADVVSYIQGHRISVTGYRSESECVRNPPVRARFYAGGSGWQVWNGKGAEPFLPEIKFFGLLFYTCGSFLPLVSRMSYYMITPQLLLIPGLLGCVENRKRKIF